MQVLYIIDLMIQRIDYPKTFHFDFSGTMGRDDKVLKDLSHLVGQWVVASRKLDGESSTLYSDAYSHARSIDSKTNWTRDIVKKIHSLINHQIPHNWRLCCENMYAVHSIEYPPGYLEGHLYLLNIWDENNNCLSWQETTKWAQIFDLPQPEVLYEGIWDEKVFKKLAKENDNQTQEGFTVRLASSFSYQNFSKSMIKYVRPNHVAPNAQHWIKTARRQANPKTPSKPAMLEYSKKTKQTI